MKTSEVVNKLKETYKDDPKSFAKAIVESLGLKPPVDILKFAQELNLKIYFEDKIKTDNKDIAWGKLYKANNKNIILLSREIPYENSRRFTLAHEVAHYLMDDKPNDVAFRTKFIFDAKEEKYNIFAINLLITDDNEYRENKKKYNKSNLANFYGVPITSLDIFDRENKN